LLYFAPPVWFVGVQQLLLGHTSPYFVHLAQLAAVAFAVALVLAVGSYLLLYRRFDRVMLRPADASDGSRRRRTWYVGRGRAGQPNFAAISAFTHVTLARSALHQGVFVAIAACGAGLVVNSLLGVTGADGSQSPERALVNAVVWAPFALMFAMSLGARAALVLPIEPRANWVFRMTENDATRAEQLNAVRHAVVRLGVVWPLAMLLPVEWAVLGTQAIPCLSLAWLAGLVLVELHMGEWARIPFTCSYMPGKRFVGHTMLIGFAAFVVFTTLGPILVLQSFRARSVWLTASVILAAVVVHLRRRRVSAWRLAPLMFEDVLPNEVEPLRLSAF
jgi:hypothetical protein